MLANVLSGHYYLEVEIDDLRHYYHAKLNIDIVASLREIPLKCLRLFGEACSSLLSELNQSAKCDIQIGLISTDNCTSEKPNGVMAVSGIIIRTEGLSIHSRKISLHCDQCNITFVIYPPCYVPKECRECHGLLRVEPAGIAYTDMQTVKLQTLAKTSSIDLHCYGYHCNQLNPGDLVTVDGIYQIGKTRKMSTIVKPFLYVTGIRRRVKEIVRAEDVARFYEFSRTPDILSELAKMIAPGIFGLEDEKKMCLCLLFGGTRKKTSSGVTLRGDINVLLMGDPGMGKSQLLKFIQLVSPIGVFTSGKGSSAAGLTASVVWSVSDRKFLLEPGAMMLADNGVICVDEFDKMKTDDRVAMHEAMEQGTISIAKAGITSTLNTRCSVLAAANPKFGRWDNTKGSENIDLLPTILSRFDLISIMRDYHDSNADKALARNVIGNHRGGVKDTVSVDELKKYINYCRQNCAPVLSPEGGLMLRSQYVLMRKQSQRSCSIPFGVRHLESLIRTSEALAKMKLQSYATEVDVKNALDLFRSTTVQSTLQVNFEEPVAHCGNLDELKRQIKRCAQIGDSIDVRHILAKFKGDDNVLRAIDALVREHIFQYRERGAKVMRINP